MTLKKQLKNPFKINIENELAKAQKKTQSKQNENKQTKKCKKSSTIFIPPFLLNFP